METALTQSKAKMWTGGKSPFNVSYGKLMMWYFLMSDSFTFGAFLISYGSIRFSLNRWVDHNYVFNKFPFTEANLPLAFVSLMTFILIFSSVTMVLAVHEGHKMNRQGVEKWLFLTVIGGLAFLGCQAWEWTHLITHTHRVLVDFPQSMGSSCNVQRRAGCNSRTCCFWRIFLWHHGIPWFPRFYRSYHQYYHAD
jgi:cytochrome c oxidase subunit 3